MPDIEVNCGSCGTVFEVAEDQAGMLASCPQCERRISVPYPDDDLVERPRLQLKKESTISGDKRCPACQGTMASGAVICIQCGYDTRTGIAHGTSGSAAKKAKSLLSVVGLIILVGVAWTAWRHFSGGSGSIGFPADNAPDSASTAPAELPKGEPTPLDEATALLNEPTGEGEMIESIMEEPAPEEAEGEVDVASLMAGERVRLKAQLDKKYPMYKLGTEVELRRTNGLINRGILTQIGRASVMLQVGEQWTEVPFKVLDKTTRLRCDKKFRDMLVEYKVRQRQKQLESK